MAEQNKGGRPPVGGTEGSTRIQFTVPAEAAQQAAQRAAEGGVSEASVHRDVYMAGLRKVAISDDRQQTTEFVRPAATIIARWIGLPEDAEDRADRFKAWHKACDNETTCVDLLRTATGDLTLAGAQIAELPSAFLLDRLATRQAWRVRNMLHLTVLLVCKEEGITVHVPDAEEAQPG